MHERSALARLHGARPRVLCCRLSLSPLFAVFGSGWCWLEICGSRVSVSWKPNQVSPVQSSCKPLLGIDVWGALPLRTFPPPSCLTRHTEHAYYLKHANKRAPYIANMVQIINVRLQFSRAILPHAVQQSASLTHRVQWDVVDQLFVTALKQLPDTVMDQLLDSLHMPTEQL